MTPHQTHTSLLSGRPLVTIVTPVLNCAPYIAACLDSVINQSYSAIEHVVVDGCSTDGTVEIIAEYAERHPGRIKYISEKDSGGGDAWNKGLLAGRGDIFGWLGGDDMFTNQAIEHVVRYMTQNPEVFFVHGSCVYVDEFGDRLRTKTSRPFTLKQLVNDGNYVSFPAAFYRREVIKAVGRPDAYGNDYEYVIRIAERFPIHHIQEPLAMFRLRPGSETSSMLYDERVRRLDYDVVRKHGAHLLSRNSLRYHAFMVAKRLKLLYAYYLLISPVRRWLVHGNSSLDKRSSVQEP